MTETLKRFYGRGDLHFVTFSCYGRLPLLGTPNTRNFFVETLQQIRQRYQFLLVGYVVMPEHVHLLMSEPVASTPSTVLKALKQRVSRDMRSLQPFAAKKRRSFGISKPENLLVRFWEHRFYDFNIYSMKKIREKLDYMHANPVQRGLVGNPTDWPWSSYLFYETGKPGLMPLDSIF